MSKNIYDEAHVVISRLIGRQYNNPLGDDAFLLLVRLLGCSSAGARVLDVGCGRGRTALWWARQGAHVVAFDPSRPMLAEAEGLIHEAEFSGRVSFVCADLQTFHTDDKFDIVITHDVLCYSDDRARDLLRLLSYCRPGGILSLSDYFGDVENPAVKEIVAAWGITAPLPFERYRDLLRNNAVDVVLMSDTTRQYSLHWRDIQRRIMMNRSLLLDAVGSSAVCRLEHQIMAIEKAVKACRFGHLWAIVEARKNEGGAKV